jgi:hypothetical protein
MGKGKSASSRPKTSGDLTVFCREVHRIADRRTRKAVLETNINDSTAGRRHSLMILHRAPVNWSRLTVQTGVVEKMVSAMPRR